MSDQATDETQFHDLGPTDALAGTGIEGPSTTDRDRIDYGAMLDVDSILTGGDERRSREEFENTGRR